MTIDAELRRARDAAFAHFGVPVRLNAPADPPVPGAPAPVDALALAASQSVTETLGPIGIVQHGRFLRLRAEDAALLAPGALVALLDAPGGAPVETRRVQGTPAFADRRRHVVEIDTAPA
jgi:hypothetical protein